MAQTGQNLVDRARELLNEASAKFYTDAQLLSWCNDGCEYIHTRMKAKLGPPAVYLNPSADHWRSPYWNSFYNETLHTVTSASTDVDLPSSVDIVLAVRHDDTEKYLRHYAPFEDRTMLMGKQLGRGSRTGAWTEINGKLRILAWPGDDLGQVTENTTFTICHFEKLVRVDLVTAVQCPDDYTQTAVLIAAAKGLFKRQRDASQLYAAAERELELIR